MKKVVFSFVSGACILISSCDKLDKPIAPIVPAETGSLNLTVHAGQVGALQKRTAINMSRLIVNLSSPNHPSISDTISLTGGSGERTERKTYSHLASQVRDQIVLWTLAVETRDQNNRTIHSGDTTFTVPPEGTLDLSMTLSAQFSMFQANFFPIRDSVTRCLFTVDGVRQGDISFAKQTRLGDTVRLTYDYLQASLSGVSHAIGMRVYGQLGGVDTLLYKGDTTITVVSGQNIRYQVVLKYVGPGTDTLHGVATMVVALGATGNVAVDGYLQSRISNGLVLWNKLGSIVEINHSEIGPNLQMTVSDIMFVPGQFGTAVATEHGEIGGGGYLSVPPDQFFPQDKTKGTVEFWIQKKTDQFIAWQSPLITFFGHQWFASGYQAILAWWGDGETGHNGLNLEIRESDLNIYHNVTDYGWNNIPINQWVHVAFVWDLQGITGTNDRMRIYRDGVLTASNTDNISSLFQDSSPVMIMANHAYSRFGNPTAHMDNLKVWNYAKTDFSDRFKE